MSIAFVYIVTNRYHTTLYVGMSTDLVRRTKKHREKFYPNSFSARYNTNKLVYYEVCESVAAALAREKQLKAGPRRKKIALINRYNPEWKDLYDIIADDTWNGRPLVDHHHRSTASRESGKGDGNTGRGGIG